MLSITVNDNGLKVYQWHTSVVVLDESGKFFFILIFGHPFWIHLALLDEPHAEFLLFSKNAVANELRTSSSVVKIRALDVLGFTNDAIFAPLGTQRSRRSHPVFLPFSLLPLETDNQIR